ncbi:MAG TPA: hypothetical protein VHK88_14410, partial [Aquihabitans sp.]|nr:hypothetical protein [Aquihabitans sp.]
MIGRDRPRALRRWSRRPLLWALAIAVPGLLGSFTEHGDVRDERRLRERAVRVEGTIDPSWDHGQTVPVAYRDPRSGDLVRSDVTILEDRPERIGPIELLVDPEDPQRVRAGPPFYADGYLLETALIWLVPVLACLAWAAARSRRLRWARRQMADPDVPSFRLLAEPRPGAVL